MIKIQLKNWKVNLNFKTIYLIQHDLAAQVVLRILGALKSHEVV